MSLQIKFYTKPNCSLCEEVEELLEEMENLFKFSAHRIDITDDLDIYEKYKHQIPVIEIGGKYYLSGKITRKELKQKIQTYKKEDKDEIDKKVKLLLKELFVL
ncbi:MAG: glutaredoxin family protein [Candidatus Aminicenantia bacterium]